MKNFINDIAKDLDEKNSNNIIRKWIRNCPKCNKQLFYKYKCSFENSERKNLCCASCVRKGKSAHNKKHYINYRNCPQCNELIVYPNGNTMMKAARKNCKCIKCAGIAIVCSKNPNDWHKKCPICQKVQIYTHRGSYISAIKNNTKCLTCGIKASLTEDVIKKRRERRLGQVTPEFNKRACKYFDNLNDQNGWNLQHALNGGEFRVIGYSLDAYDKIRNIVVEYDEPMHYNLDGNLRFKDVIRQQRIISHLGCKFFRYNEKTKTLYEII